MSPDKLSLAALRAEIDLIDSNILDLIERRLAAARAIAEAKEAEAPPLLKLRPRRHADVIARLQRRAQTAPPEAIRHIWRELMAHSLEAQAPTRILVCGAPDPELLLQIRDSFGSAPIIEHVTPDEALRRARHEEAIAVLPSSINELPADLAPIQILSDPAGHALATAIGRVAPEEALPPPRQLQWSPATWRGRKTAQMPIYPDAAALAEVEAALGTAPPVIEAPVAAELKTRLAQVADGKAILLQGGDCAESFAGFGAERVRADYELMLAAGTLLGDNVVHVARTAGQFGKPRSTMVENRDGCTLPSYRGDAVNGADFAHASRSPDPRRLLRAYRQSRATEKLLHAYSAAEAVGGGAGRVYASHEALLLNYEQALTRRDPETGRWWAHSGHMLWIGDRTRDLDGAHVEYARGIANPIGLKCGPGLTPSMLAQLIDRLDPLNEPGRLVLIGRFGAAEIARHLPALMRLTKDEGRRVVWAIDPMHGNSRTAGNRKTRLVKDIVSETASFIDIAEAEGVHPGGIHLEMTAAPVTECVGGTVAASDLDRRYETLCDPRLNACQTLDLAGWLGRRLAQRMAPVSNAA